MTTIAFNQTATSALQGRPGAKLRMEVRNGVMFVRPTDRKAGPHVLAEVQSKGKQGVSITLDDKQAEKLGAAAILQPNSAFNVVKDKYGWFALQPGAEHEEAAGGGKATVSAK